jgi:hypothetical protein
MAMVPRMVAKAIVMAWDCHSKMYGKSIVFIISKLDIQIRITIVLK